MRLKAMYNGPKIIKRQQIVNYDNIHNIHKSGNGYRIYVDIMTGEKMSSI